ncbi:MAG TPA: YhjD/YihY/BrkB family envelope integrity protein [Candidatus Saccharimonadales bacterium]
MNSIQKLLTRVDSFQQRHPVLAFPLAVIKKFGDDQAGYQAALITYYGFLSLFPLFMVALSLLPLVAGNNPELQQSIIGGALDYFPLFGDDLRRNIVAYRAHGAALIVGLLFAFYGARGIANVLQDVSNAIWQVPKNKRPGFPLNLLRSMGIIVVGGTGLVITTVSLGFVAAQTGWGVAGKVLLAVAALVLNTLVFWLIARLATVNRIATRSLLVGAVTAACFWLLLQLAGTTLLIHQLKGASALYGTFAVVLGLLFWLYMQAELYVYALEINVVKSKKLWPRKLFDSDQELKKQK